MGSERDNYTFSNQASIPPAIAKKLTDFFRSYDDPNTDHSYLNIWHPTEGTLVFGRTVKGHDEIRGFHDALIHPTNGPVVDLEHTLDKCFVLAGDAGKGRQEVIVNGSLWYKLKNGRKIDVDFASMVQFVDRGQGDGPLAEFYEVYLDAHELMTAMKEMSEEGK